MNYKIVTDRIEVRSLTENNKPRYIVNGTAVMANKKHVYDYAKNRDGSVKTLKNLFTTHCIESIKKQAKNKPIFVDVQHELVRNASIKEIIKGKLTGEEQKRVGNMLKGKKLPIAKLNDIDIDGDSLNVYTELNSMYREIDSDCQKEFDAIWYSLDNKFLNGISINFGEAMVAEDENGDKVIDDIELLGFSYVDSAAGHEHSITEVAIRALGDGIEGEKMKEEKEKLEAEKAKVEEERKKVEEEKAAIEKKKTEDAEEAKKAEVKKQEEEQKNMEEKLAKTAEDLKKAEEEKAKLQGDLNSAKGVVPQVPPPAQPGAGEKVYDEKFYKENINEITAEHDETIKILKSGKEPSMDNRFKGFSKLSVLSTKGSPTAGMDGEDAAIVQGSRLLEKSDADLIGVANKQNR